MYVFTFLCKQPAEAMKYLFLIIGGLLLYGSLYAQDQQQESLAFKFIQEGAYDKASPLLEQLVKQHPADENYFELYLNALLKTGKYPQAEQLVRQMAKTYPGRQTYLVALGRVYKESGKTAEAEKLFNEAIQRLQNNEQQVRELANLFYRFEAYELAVSTFLQGRKLSGKEQEYVYELISIYRFKKDKVRLIEEYLIALRHNPPFIQNAQNALSNLFEDNADYQLLQQSLLKKIQREPEIEVYNQLLIWQYMQQKHYQLALRQVIAYDRRVPADEGNLLYQTANSFLANNAYETAIQAFEQLLHKGPQHKYYLSSKIQLVDAKFKLVREGRYRQEELQPLADQYLAIIDSFGKTVQTVFALQRWAHLQAFYLNDLPKAEKALEECLQIPGLSPQESGRIKLELGDLYVLTQQPWEAALFYEQVARQFEGVPIGQEATFRSAKLYFYKGEFAYAKSHADVLKASTSQLIANDALNLSLLLSDHLQTKNDSLALTAFAAAELLKFENKPAAALATLDSIPLRYPGNTLGDDILMAKSRLWIDQKEFAKASEFLEELVREFPESIWVDDALFTLGDLFEHRLQQPEKAKACYQRLMLDFPASIYQAEGRKRFRNLRGDTGGV